MGFRYCNGVRVCPGTGSKKRMPLKASIKHEVNLRDRGECQICKSKKWTEIHHILPIAKGGGNQAENLTTLCWQHHQMSHLDVGIKEKRGKNRMEV